MSNGQRPARTAQDVAQLEADNEFYHGEVERLTRELAVIAADRSRLQVENAMLAGNSRDNLVKATRMETIVRQVSAGLVTALQEITQERRVQTEMRRQVQEEQLTEETGAAPSFLRRAPEQRSQGEAPSGPGQEVARPVAQASAQVDRTREVARAAEMIAPPNRPNPARIDPTLADKDSRLPGPPQYGQRTDTEDLEHLAGNIESRRQ